MAKKKVKIVSEPTFGSNSFYRTVGPLSKLQNVDYDLMKDVNWSTVANGDILFVENPRKAEHMRCIEIAKNEKLKVWVDYDDNLFATKLDNPRHNILTDQNTRSIVIKSLMFADVVTVTTGAIKNAYNKYNKNIEVIPNAFNDYVFDFKYHRGNTQIINWRGGDSHRYNIIQYLEQIKSIAKSRDDYLWHFIGKKKDLWFVGETVRNCSIKDQLPLHEYFMEILSVNPAIQLVLLQFDPFDECRSNIAWLEGTFAGAATIAPQMEEWNKGCIMNYTRENFEEQLLKLMDDPDLQGDLHERSFVQINEKLKLSDVNQRRYEIVDGL